jgi:hypothetical protein
MSAIARKVFGLLDLMRSRTSSPQGLGLNLEVGAGSIFTSPVKASHRYAVA